MARMKSLTASLLCLGAAAFGLHAMAQDAPEGAAPPAAVEAAAQEGLQASAQGDASAAGQQAADHPAVAQPQGEAPPATPQQNDAPATAAQPAEATAAPSAAAVQPAAAGAGSSSLPRASLSTSSSSAGRAEVEIESVRPSASTPSDEAELRIRGIRTNEYFYQSYGRPDLCRALVTGKFEPVGNPEIVDVNSAKLVGIMWGASDRFALLEDGYGNGFILHAGDRVRNGRIEAINETSVVASITLYGITSRVILRLEPQREGKKR
jgi:hypothetical protein